MVTYETLVTYLNKLDEAYKATNKAYQTQLAQIKITQGYASENRDRLIAIDAQRITVKELMDIEKTPPVVDLPFAGDEIQELYDNRLKGNQDVSEDELLAFRQDDIYSLESEHTAEFLHELNEEADKARGIEVAGTKEAS